MVYFSNLYFVRSIVEPVAGITETARRIADGSYGIQIEKKFDDEIGELTDTINDMSLKIKQSEKMKSRSLSPRSPMSCAPPHRHQRLGGDHHERGVRDAEDVRRGWASSCPEARRLTNMVEELLEFSRIEDGRFTLSIEPMDIKAGAGGRGVHLPGVLPPGGHRPDPHRLSGGDSPISGDPERLRQVFCNLLDNAAKHGGSGKRIDVPSGPGGGGGHHASGTTAPASRRSSPT